MKNKHFVLAIIAWVFLLSVSYYLNYDSIKQNTLSNAKNRAEAFFSEIQATRLWNSNTGGIYVPVTDKNQPNPYLKVLDRDVVTTTGVHLTKINPAYMTRQIAEIQMKQDAMHFHITSLKPIRPANKGDWWEEKALTLFEKGAKDCFEAIKKDSISSYRYMAPLIVKESCLKCHAEQGYKLGDVRGGISISFPMKLWEKTERSLMLTSLFAHLFVLFIGLLGIFVYYWMSRNYVKLLKSKNSELLESEQQLSEMVEKLEKLNASKDKFFSIISHDLKNPFNSIIGFSELLMMNQDYDKQKVKEFSRIIYESATSTFGLLENLLEWSRTQRGDIIYSPSEINLLSVINSSIEVVHLTALKKNVEIKIISEKLDTLVFADPNMLKTVMRNLLANAVKYSYPYGNVEITLKCESGFAIVSILDHGVGLSAEDVEKLFKLEIKYSTAGTSGEKGTGLGLILCKEFIEAQSGTIWVESQLGIGSEFKFTIPLVK